MKKLSPLFGPCLVLGCALAVALTACRSADTAQSPVPQPPLRAVNSPAPPPAPPAVVASAPAPASATHTAQVQPTAPAASAPAGNTAAETPAAPSASAAATDAANEGVPLARVGPQPPSLAPGVQGVVDLVQAQVSTNVLIEYIQTTTNSLALEAEDILYLKDIGVPEEVISAMLKRGGDQRAAEVLATATVTEAAAAPAATTETAAAPPSAPAPASTYDQTVSAPPPPPAAPPPTAPPVTENYFYRALTPYGSWLYIAPYGWCWQPTVAVLDRSWRPYLHGGRWVYTSAGWYWQSYYTWGWAPFHYGNWYLSPACGWVWVPGHVWAPAWVTWRYSDAYCGWAPLPPGCAWHPGFGLTYRGSRVSVSFGFNLGWNSFVFCAWDDWWRPHPYRYCLPPHRTAVVYNQTTIINNFYVDKSRNTIVNEGVPPQAMPARVRQELRKVELADAAPGSPHLLRPERATVTGGKLAVYRPQVPPDLKLASAKPGEAPLRPLRSRQEGAAPARAARAPEALPHVSSGRPERIGPTPARSAPSASAPTRVTPPVRSETPGAGVTVTPPARSGSVANPTAPAPSRRQAPAAAPPAPVRREAVVPTPSQPGRAAPPAAGQATPQRVTPNRSSPPARDAAPVARPPVPTSPSRTVPGNPAPSRTQLAPPPAPVTRSEAQPPAAARAVPNRSVPPGGNSAVPAVPRATPSSPPMRMREPDWNTRAPAPAWSSPPSRSATPPTFPAPNRAMPSAPQPGIRSSPPPASSGFGGGRGAEGGERSRPGRSSNIQER